MTKKILISICAVIISNGVFGQRKKAEDIDWSYELLRNNPNSSYFGGGVGFDIFLSGFNEAWFVPDFNVFWLTPRFQAHMNGKLFLVESHNSFGPTYDSFSIYELEKSKNIEFTGTYYFSNKIKKKDVAVTLASFGAGRMKVSLIQKIPSNVSQRLGLDLGISHGFTFYEFTNGPQLALDNQGQIENFQSHNPTLNYQSSILEYSFLKTGFNYTIVKNTEIDHATYGIRRSFSVWSVYGQFLYGMRQQLDNVYAREIHYYSMNGTQMSDEYYKEYDIHTNMEYSNAGFLVGARYFGTHKFAASYHVQFGFYPGPKDAPQNNMSLNLGIGLQLGKLYNEK